MCLSQHLQYNSKYLVDTINLQNKQIKSYILKVST